MNFSTELLKPASIVLLQFRNQTNASERLFLADLQSVTDSKRKKLSFPEKVPLFIRLLKRDSASDPDIVAIFRIPVIKVDPGRFLFYIRDPDT